MQRRHIICFLLTCMAMTACVREYQEKPENDPPVFELSGDMAPGVMRIKVTEELAAQLEQQADPQGVIRNTGVKSSDDILGGIGFESMQRTFPPAGKFEARTRAEGLHLWYNVKFSPETNLTKAGTEISNIEGVRIIEGRPKISRPNYKTVTVEPADLPSTKAESPQDIFDDPKLNQQWHYYNDGTYKGKAGCDINVLPVWEKGYFGRPDVIVAVTDGGVDHDHVDLKDNIWINEAELNGTEGVDDDGNGYVDDIYGYDFVYDRPIYPDDHGTHVAGTIAAVNNNGIGVSGIAGGNKALGIQGVKIMSCQVFYGDWDSAWDFAPAFTYAADNGAVISQNSWGADTPIIYQSDKDAIDYFIKYAGVDENGNKTGPMKGGIVIFAGGNDERPYSSPGGYEHVIGVSAIAADYEIAYYSNYGEWADIAAPGGDAYKNQLVLSTVTNNRYDYYQGTSMACPHVSGVAALMISIYGGEGFTNEELWNMLLDNTNPIIYDGHNSRYQGQLGTGLLDAGAILEANPLIPPSPVTDLKAETMGTTEIKLEWTVPVDETRGFPSYFNIYYSTEKFDTSLDRNNLPENVNTIRIDNDLEAGQTATYTLENLQDDITYYISMDADNGSSKSGLSSVAECKTATNFPPEIVKQFPNITLMGPGYKTDINLYDYFADPNEESLEFSANIVESPQVAEVSVNGNFLNITASETGHAIVKAEATDKLGKRISANFNVTVLDSGVEYFCYPNPVIDILNIKTSAAAPASVSICIESLSGTTVFGPEEHTVSSSETASIDIGALKAGNYSVIITDSQNKATVQNITKL